MHCAQPAAIECYFDGNADSDLRDWNLAVDDGVSFLVARITAEFGQRGRDRNTHAGILVVIWANPFARQWRRLTSGPSARTSGVSGSAGRWACGNSIGSGWLEPGPKFLGCPAFSRSFSGR